MLPSGPRPVCQMMNVAGEPSFVARIWTRMQKPTAQCAAEFCHISKKDYNICQGTSEKVEKPQSRWSRDLWRAPGWSWKAISGLCVLLQSLWGGIDWAGMLQGTRSKTSRTPQQTHRWRSFVCRLLEHTGRTFGSWPSSLNSANSPCRRSDSLQFCCKIHVSLQDFKTLLSFCQFLIYF